MKYIDADHLKVEIEKHIKEVKDVARRFPPNMGFFDAKISGIYDVMAIIDSLQQEQQEVDLEDEMEKFGERWPYPASFDGYDKDWVDELTEECAKHFYELGKNSK